MKLTPVRRTCPDKTTCPTAYATDRGTFFVQGWQVTDPDGLSAIAELGIPTGETIHEVPASMFPDLATGS